MTEREQPRQPRQARIEVPKGVKVLNTFTAQLQTTTSTSTHVATQGRSGMWYFVFTERVYAVEDQHIRVLGPA